MTSVNWARGFEVVSRSLSGATGVTVTVAILILLSCGSAERSENWPVIVAEIISRGSSLIRRKQILLRTNDLPLRANCGGSNVW